ncbi:DUF1573 domain-containing protein [Bacteroides fragilis]|nr:DUF1573 domain-containing protein [Bacteroides fragilis]
MWLPLVGVLPWSIQKNRFHHGKSLDIIVTYKADHPEHFNKTITVYCNSSVSPLRLKIMGNAK